MSGPGLYEHIVPVAWRDGFTSHKMQLGWYRKSKLSSRRSNIWSACLLILLDTPLTTDFSLTEHPGYLRVYGGPYSLSVPACPTMFLRKQTHRHCTWETRLSFLPVSDHTEAGTVLWWNHFTYSSLGIRKSGSNRIIKFCPSEGISLAHQLSLKAEVILVIECGEKYRFGYREVTDCEGTDSDINWVGTVDNRLATRSPPVGAPFTGMMFGLYAYGERKRCLAPADFAYAEIREAT